MYKILRYKSVHDFLSFVEPMLLAREAENCLMLGLCRSLASSVELPNEILLLVVTKDSLPYSAAVQTPPFNLIVSKSNKYGLNELANFLSVNEIKIPGVVGPKSDATSFAEIYSSKMNCKMHLGMDQKIYEATQIAIPQVNGSLKVANESELDIIYQWLYEFSAESLPEREKFNLDYAQDWAKKAIFEKSAYLWIDLNGVPVSVAHTGKPTPNGISIRAVYTPPVYRKLGFGSAVVASLSKKMLESSYKFCCLYTDASNATSNKIYEAVGYKIIAESNHYNFC